MPVQAEFEIFSTPTATGTQSLSLSNFTETPNVAIFFSVNKNATSGTDAFYSLGFAVRNGSTYSSGYCLPDALSLFSSGEVGLVSSTSTVALWRHTGTYVATKDVEFTISAWSSSSITLNYTTVAGTSRRIGVLFLNGDWSILTHTQSGTSNASLTGAGFRPNVYFTMPTISSGTNGWMHPGLGLGMVDSDGVAFCTSRRNTWDSGTKRVALETSCFVGADYSASIMGRCTHVSYDSDGITIGNPVSNSTYNKIVFLVGRINGRAELDVTSYNSASLQTQAVTAGCTLAALISTGIARASGTLWTTDRIALGVGASDLTTEKAMAIGSTGNHGGTTNTGYVENTGFATTMDAHNATKEQRVYSSRDSGQYVVYPSIAGNTPIATLAFLNTPSGGERHTQGYPFIKGKYPMIAKLPVDGDWTALGYQQITSLSSATALTVPSGSKIAVVQAETQNVRWRDDGSNPTSLAGMLIEAGYSHVFGGSLSALKFIEVNASAKLNVSYYK